MLYLTTKHVAALWHYVIENDLIGLDCEFRILSIDTAESVIVEGRYMTGYLQDRPPFRFKLYARGGYERLAVPALEDGSSKDDSDDPVKVSALTRDKLEGPTSKQLSDRARAAREIPPLSAGGEFT